MWIGLLLLIKIIKKPIYSFTAEVFYCCFGKTLPIMIKITLQPCLHSNLKSQLSFYKEKKAILMDKYLNGKFNEISRIYLLNISINISNIKTSIIYQKNIRDLHSLCRIYKECKTKSIHFIISKYSLIARNQENIDIQCSFMFHLVTSPLSSCEDVLV